MFNRSKQNPILRPNPKHHWESEKLYNPGAIFCNEKYHLYYRAIGHGKNWKSDIGYAVSKDGEKFKRFKSPLLTSENKIEKRGLEDPRITKIDDMFYMTYTAFDGITPRLSIATSPNLKKWQEHGPVFSDWSFDEAGGVYKKWNEEGKIFTKLKQKEWSKSGAIFPEKINGQFYMLFGEYNIWFATSSDGLHWTGDQKPFLGARRGNFFDNTFVEMGPPPIKTKKGWLVLYHGIDKKYCYRIGFLLLDLNNPRKIIHRSTDAIFEPIMDYELGGIVDVISGGLDKMENMSKLELKKYLQENAKKKIVPKVVFCCGAILKNKTLSIFYGAGDSVICTANTNIDKILNLTKLI